MGGVGGEVRVARGEDDEINEEEERRRRIHKEDETHEGGLGRSVAERGSDERSRRP